MFGRQILFSTSVHIENVGGVFDVKTFSINQFSCVTYETFEIDVLNTTLDYNNRSLSYTAYYCVLER